MGLFPFALLAALAAASIPGVPTPEEEMFAALPDLASRMTIEAHVNGRGPYRFTIDTGADRSVISDRLAAQLALPAGRNVSVFGIAGPQSIPTVLVDQLKVGRHERRDLSAPVLSERALGSAGFLGIDALHDQRVLLDFKRNRVTLARSPEEAMVGDPDAIIVTGRSRFGQLILTDAKIGAVKVYAIIDTGAENTIGNLTLRRMLGRLGPVLPGRGAVVGVTGVELPADPGMVPRIRLGGMSLSNMPIAFADVATFRLFGIDDKPAILVGMDVLRGFERVAIDFKRREVRFRVGEGPLGQS